MITEKPAMACLHERFERHAEASPESIALVTKTERVTYRELNVRANRVAHLLQTLGVGPDNVGGRPHGTFLEPGRRASGCA